MNYAIDIANVFDTVSVLQSQDSSAEITPPSSLIKSAMEYGQK